MFAGIMINLPLGGLFSAVRPCAERTRRALRRRRHVRRRVRNACDTVAGTPERGSRRVRVEAVGHVQRRSQLQQLLGTILERAEDRLPIGDVERDDLGFAVVGAFEDLGGVDDLGLAEAGGGRRTILSATGIPASHMAATVHRGPWAARDRRRPIFSPLTGLD